jgi:uncharacterized protein with NRDE domain
MCLIALALRASERFPLVIAGNRDEFLARPTLPLDLWHSSQGTSILGGRDLQDGGSWMGFTPEGRFAVLTNVRNPQATAPAHPISRGSLVVNWLDSSLIAEHWAQQHDAAQFNGFNLIAGDWATGETTYLSHPVFLEQKGQVAGIKYTQSAMNLVVSHLPSDQVHGLSNAALNTPWPKTVQLQVALEAALKLRSTEALTSALLHALADPKPAPEHQLPATGLPHDLEKALSSAFVSHPIEQPRYGTRTSWVAVLMASGELTVTEAMHSHDGKPPILRQSSLHWQG